MKEFHDGSASLCLKETVGWRFQTLGADGKGVETLTFERGREGGEVISFKENRTPSLPPELWEGEDSHTRER